MALPTRVLPNTSALNGAKRVPRYGECTAGNLMADAARWYVETQTLYSQLPWDQSVAGAVWHAGSMSHTDLGLNAGTGKKKLGRNPIKTH